MKYKNRISVDEQKKICLNMLIEFDRVCQEKKLRYIIDYGTLLGCIRHKGFIPWDDDIDVTMPREDYEKLLNIALKDESLFGKFKFASIYNNNNIYKGYSNLVDPTTISISNQRKEKYFYPLWIDIFPMDFAKKENIEETFELVERKLNKAYRPLMHYKNALKRLYVLMFYNSRSSVKCFKEADLIAKTCEGGGDLLTNYFSRYKSNDLSEISFYDEYILGEFESHQFRIPKNYDKRLVACYGDYMKMPSKENRITHFVEAYYID